MVLESNDSDITQRMYRNIDAIGFWVRLVGVRAMIKRYFQDMRDGVRNQDGLQDENTDTAPYPNPRIQTSLFVTCMTKLAAVCEYLPTRFQLSRDPILRRHDVPALVQVQLDSRIGQLSCIRDYVNLSFLLCCLQKVEAERCNQSGNTSNGVEATYYIMNALAGVQFIFCLFFIKEYSLKRDDDEKQKEAKMAEGDGKDVRRACPIRF